MSPKQPSKDVEKIGEFNPCDHAYDYVDGDMDDYGKGDEIGGADRARRDYSEDESY